jgi:uncharacterized membrane protein required for colicin V production
MEISAQAAVIDIFFLILCLRILYISVSRGIVCEVLKIIGLLAGALFAFQYYSSIAATASNKIPFFRKEHLEGVVFFLILLVIGIVFHFVQLIVTFLFKREQIPRGERWLSFFLGGTRVSFSLSVIIFLLSLFSFTPQDIYRTISYGLFKNIAPKVYLVSFGFYNKINPKAVLNKEVEAYYETEKSLSGDSKKGY